MAHNKMLVCNYGNQDFARTMENRVNTYQLVVSAFISVECRKKYLCLKFKITALVT